MILALIDIDAAHDPIIIRHLTISYNKSYTPADIDFLYSHVSSTLPGRASITDESLLNVQ